MIQKITSGGQSGVDRAALDVAIMLNIPQGGWCPRGRLAEDGTIPLKYLLQETESSDYSERTKLNLRDADGTLVIVPEEPIKISAGTILTINEAKRINKPLLIIDLNNSPDVSLITQWIIENNIHTLNIAGPRESQAPGIYAASFKLLVELFCFSSR